MNKTYQPDSKFVERLEWQLSSEYRRLDRMKSSGRVAVSRRAVATALMAGVLMTGVAAIKAADYLRESWRKKIEMARVQTEVEIRRVRLESVRELAARNERLFANGLIREEENLVTKIEAEKAGLDLERSLLNLDEVKASGVPPRDELHAPLAGGRDFVTERLRNEIRSAEVDLDLLKNHWDRFQELVEKGLAPQEQLDRIQAEIETRQGTIDAILKRIELRKEFVAGAITAQEVEIRGRMSTAEKNLSVAQAQVDFLKQQLERLQTQEAAGTVSPMETGQMRYALDIAQAQLKLAALEIDVLRKVK